MVKIEERDDVKITSRGWWEVAERIVTGTLIFSVLLLATTILPRQEELDAQLIFALYAFAIAIPVQGGALVMLSFLKTLIGTGRVGKGTEGLVLRVAYFGAVLAIVGAFAVFWHFSLWVGLIFGGLAVVSAGLTFSTLLSV
jgi:hypothetical protein